MVEYIEREKAIAICQSHYEYCLKVHNFSGDSVAYDIRSNIQGLPTADVVEVKHGEWVAGHFEGGIFDGTNFEKCNVCQFERLFDDIRFKTTYNYCPICGAKMDKKEGAEE